jgi:SAM-dependent methyltransferase
MSAPDPTPLYQLATGYWPSATLLAANDLGVFPAIANGAGTAAEIAGAIQADARATEILLDACVGLQLLTKTGARYQLTPAAADFLIPSSARYLGAALRWSADQYAAWGKLAAAVRTGHPAVDPAQHLGADPAQTRAFVLGMHQRAQGIARGVVPFLDFSGCRHLLDVGGGPGTYAGLLAQKYPDLRVTVLDLPGIVAVARELIHSPAVTTQAGDATTGEYGVAQYDAVLFSGVLHQMNPATIQRMLAGARRALRPGGRVIVSDMMLDATKTQPGFSTLFSLQMFLTTTGGAVFAANECVAWLTAAGFTGVRTQTLPPPLPYTVISGTT